MPKILVAISSCLRYEANHQSMRDTWLKEATALGMHYSFFVEQQPEPRRPGRSVPSDVIFTNGDEGAMTHRLKFKVHYAYAHGYDFVFCCFPDTYVRPERLLASGFEKFDYFGTVYCHPNGTPYCQGGAGYMLSRAAMKVVIDEPSDYLNDDCWLGDVLAKTSLSRGHSEDFHQWYGSPLKSNTSVTSHLSHTSNLLGVPYDAHFMYDEHKHWLES